MDRDILVAKNFRPRDNVKEEGERIIQEQIKQAHTAIEVKVVIVDQGENFFISGVALTEKKLFSSQAEYRKKAIWGWPRNWQVAALAFVVKDLLRQVRSYFPARLSIKSNFKVDEKL